MAVNEIAPITDHIAKTIGRLPQQFQGLEKKYPSPLDSNISLSGWEALITALVNPAQEFEDICTTILSYSDLEAAQHTSLDRLGSLVGLKRDGLNDEDYRVAIYVQIGKLTSEGRHADISDLLTLIGSVDKFCLEPAPASIIYYLGSIPAGKVESARQILEVAKAAGITHQMGGIPNSDPDNPVDPFVFSGGIGSSFGVLNTVSGNIEGGHYTLNL